MEWWELEGMRKESVGEGRGNDLLRVCCLCEESGCGEWNGMMDRENGIRIRVNQFTLFPSNVFLRNKSFHAYNIDTPIHIA